jgi:hypothetical protein
MMDVRKFALVGLLGLGVASIGCGSKSSSTGTGGSNGSGGSGKGGGSASGGSSGSNGSGGSAAPTTGCLASDPPMSATIADFASGALDGGIETMGGIFTYGDIPPPGYTPMVGSIEITDNVLISPTKNHYQGFGIFFNGNTDGTDCIDASQYTGIQFDISGSLVGTGCTVQFSINDSEHADMTTPKSGTTVSFDAGVDGGFMPQDPKASGPKGAYAPQLQIGPMIMSGTTTIKVPFSGTDPNVPTGGLPADTAIDTKRIEGVQWQLTTPLMADGGAEECDLDIKISNVKFYK